MSTFIIFPYPKSALKSLFLQFLIKKITGGFVINKKLLTLQPLN